MPKRDLYHMPTVDAISLSDRHDGTIIAAGPWLRGNGEVPHRIILRMIGLIANYDSFVVHQQVFIDSGYPSYNHGTYFSRQRHNDVDPFVLAWLKFEERCRLYLSIQDKPEPVDSRATWNDSEDDPDKIGY